MILYVFLSFEIGVGAVILSVNVLSKTHVLAFVDSINNYMDCFHRAVQKGWTNSFDFPFGYTNNEGKDFNCVRRTNLI